MRLNKSKIIYFTIINMGVISIIAQSSIIRELLVQFHGNELSIGIVLSFWMIFEAAGAGLVSFLFKKTINIINYLFYILLISLIFYPLIFILSNNINSIFNIMEGEIVGIIPTILSTLIIISPAAIILGFQFALSCMLLKKYKTSINKSEKIISDTYFLEALGWLIGGILFSFLLIHIMDNFEILLTLSILNIINIYLLSAIYKNKIVIMLSTILFLFIIIFVISPLKQNYYRKIIKNKYPDNYSVVDTVNSVYGKNTVIKNKNQINIFQNGILSISSNNLISAEEFVHFSLLNNPEIENVILVGSGFSGSLKQIIKYPNIKNIYYLEKDPSIITLGKKYFKSILPRTKKIKFLTGDARFLINKNFKKNSIDALLVNISDPYNAQLNRYYTLDFFKEVRNVLKKDGLFTITMKSSETYISNELNMLNSSIYHSVKKIFENTILIPGNNAIIVSSNNERFVFDKNNLKNNFKLLNMKNKYVNNFYIDYRIDSVKIKWVNNRLNNIDILILNRDLNPVSYYYSIELWVSSFHINTKKFFNFIQNNLNLKTLLIIFLFIFIIKQIFFRKKIDFTLYTNIMLIGFITMSYQIYLIHLFQILYGHIYGKIALLTAMNMAGMAAGSRIIDIKKRFKIKNILFRLIIFMIFFLGSNFLFILLKTKISSNLIYNFIQILIFIGSFLMGFLCGALFVQLNKIYYHNQNRNLELRNSGRLYGFDLLGGSLGALISGTFFIPILGLGNYLILLIIIAIYIFLDYQSVIKNYF